jgi:hypothetical protein
LLNVWAQALGVGAITGLQWVVNGGEGSATWAHLVGGRAKALEQGFNIANWLMVAALGVGLVLVVLCRGKLQRRACDL